MNINSCHYTLGLQPIVNARASLTAAYAAVVVVRGVPAFNKILNVLFIYFTIHLSGCARPGPLILQT